MNRIALVLALSLCPGIGITPFSLVAQDPGTVQKPMGDVSGVSGWIEDGLVHTAGTSSDTVKKNVSGGAPLVFVDDQSKRVFTIDNPEKVKGHEGHHVSFSGSMDSVAKTIHVTTLSMMKSQKPGAQPEVVGH